MINLSHKFEKICKEYGNKTAIRFLNNTKITFDELNIKSQQLAIWISKNVKIGDRIGIISDKNPIVFYLIFACLRAGVSYTILDKDNPDARNQKIIEILNPKIIFVSGNKKVKLTIKNYQKIILEKEIKKIIENQTYEKFLLNFASEKIAYIMFTSGSTGEPKGARITHKNILNFIKWSKEEYKFKKDEIFANLNGLHFDNSVFDIYASLFNGYTLVPFNKSDLINPKIFLNFLSKFKITNWFSVPSLLIYFLKLNSISKKKFKTIKRIIFGGEAFPKKELKVLFDKVGHKISLFNVYGPTECTCICSNYKIKKNDFSKKEMSRFAPLGKKMISKFKYKIIDNGQKVNTGNKGELILEGENVGKGYIKNIKETKKRFFFKKQKNLKRFFYKTGDIVYKDKINNLIYFVARSDNQIKYMGYRIELNEIEENINRLSDVRLSVVTYGKKGYANEITAWIELKNYNKKINIKSKLSQLLPSYMVPRNFYYKKKLQLNTNGKIDRKGIAKNYYD